MTYLVAYYHLLIVTLIVFSLVFCQWLISFQICQCSRQSTLPVYLIILGAGLIDGQQISLTLKSRLNKGLKFARQQYLKTARYPLLILSGGQGSDEIKAESIVMYQYCLSQGYPQDRLLIEVNSTSTFTNLWYTLRLMQELDLPLDQGGIVSSNYHLPRASYYAHHLKLNLITIGARDQQSFKVFLKAAAREYAAALRDHFQLIYYSIIVIIVCWRLIN